MDHPEVLGSASASEVPVRPPGSGYNFRPRSRSATAPKNRRLGSVETPGVGSTLDLPAVTPPNSPTPSGAENPTHGNTEINIPTIISQDSTTTSNQPFSTLVEFHNSTLVQLVAHNSATRPSSRNSTVLSHFSIEYGIRDIFCFRGVILCPYKL